MQDVFSTFNLHCFIDFRIFCQRIFQHPPKEAPADLAVRGEAPAVRRPCEGHRGQDARTRSGGPQVSRLGLPMGDA